MQNVGIITQARMTSSRLPGKIFKRVNNVPLLKYHIERILKTGFRVIVATTANSTDDIVAEFAQDNNIDFYRGSETNVLSRFYEAAVKFKLDTIIRVTSDCPLVDPYLIRNNVENYVQLNDKKLYMSNGIERTYARGFDFEVFSFELLKEAHENATDLSDLEHVTPYIWKNRSGNVTLFSVQQADNNSNLRVTVDTQEDFELVKILIEKYDVEKLAYSEIEAILLQHPELIALNSHIEQKKV